MGKALDRKLAKIAGNKPQEAQGPPRPKVIRIRLPKHLRDGRMTMEVYK